MIGKELEERMKELLVSGKEAANRSEVHTIQAEAKRLWDESLKQGEIGCEEFRRTQTLKGKIAMLEYCYTYPEY